MTTSDIPSTRQCYLLIWLRLLFLTLPPSLYYRLLEYPLSSLASVLGCMDFWWDHYMVRWQIHSLQWLYGRVLKISVVVLITEIISFHLEIDVIPCDKWLIICMCTDAAPALTPNIVIWLSSPPNALTLDFTQRNANDWSFNPKLPGQCSSPVDRKPTTFTSIISN